jgi:hypothetical protein
MKIARSRLKQIIQEELRRALTLKENYSLSAHKMEDEMAYEGQRGSDERGQHDNDSDPEDPLAEEDELEGYSYEEGYDLDELGLDEMELDEMGYEEEGVMDEEYDDEGHMMETETEDESVYMAEIARRLRNRRRGV